MKTHPIRVIGLDTGTRTGVAWTDEFRASPSNSTYWDLKDVYVKHEPRGARWMRFRELLGDLIEGSPTAGVQSRFASFIFYEEIKFASSYNAAHSYHSLIAQVEELCIKTHSLCFGVSPFDMKWFATKNRKAGKNKMIEAANKRYGCNLADDNQVDALFALEVGLEEMQNEPERFWL